MIFDWFEQSFEAAMARYLQFSLRSLFLFSALVSVPAIIAGKSLRQYQRETAISADMRADHMTLEVIPAPQVFSRIGLEGLVHIREVRLDSDDPISDRFVQQLNELRHLEALILRSVPIKGEIPQLSGLRNVRYLELSNFKFSDESMAAFIDQMPQLEKVEITPNDNEIGPKTFAALGHLTHLKCLKLRNVTFSSEAFERLGDSPLQIFELTGARLDRRCQAHLAKLPVRMLTLGGCEIENYEDSHLFRMPKLEQLEISGRDFENSWLAHLDPTSPIRSLSLDCTKIDDQGLREIAKLQNLRALSVREGNVTDAGVLALAKCPNLREVYFRHTATTDLALDLVTQSRSVRLMSLPLERTSREAIHRVKLLNPKAEIRCFSPVAKGMPMFP